MVRMGDVGRLGEVEEVGVVAELELSLAFVVCSKQRRQKGLIADTEDTRWAERAGEETRVRGRAVVLENGFLSQGLRDALVLDRSLADSKHVPLCWCSSQAAPCQSQVGMSRRR